MCKAQYEEGYSKMDMQWVKIKRRIGYVRGDSIDLETYTTKYADRDILITDDKNNTGLMVKSVEKR